MNLANLISSAPLKFWTALAAFSRLMLWLALLFWGVFALTWFVLHGVIVPRIDTFRPQIEKQASAALGVPVRIGSIIATSHGLIPSFELKDVVLLDAQSREALHLKQILVAVSNASILQLNTEQIYIDQPDLEIRRTQEGKLLVAGLDLAKSDSASSGGLDWFFSQPEFVIRNGTVHWVDEQSNGDMGVPPPLSLTQVDFVSRNPFNKHLLRLDATPPTEWGQRMSLQGVFKQSLLSTDKGKWGDWTGEIYTDFSKIDVSLLSLYVPFGNLAGSGVGSLRAWTQLSKGAWASSTADIALEKVDATLGAGLKSLNLQTVTGRLQGKKIKNGLEFSTKNLQFKTHDDVIWPGGNVFFSQTAPNGIGELRADKLDLATLSLIANRLPLGKATHAQLESLAPKGMIQTINATWRGNYDAPTALTAKGQITGLEIASKRSELKVGEGPNAHEDLGRPGVRNARVDFDFDLAGGAAKFVIENGAVDVPGVFEESAVPVAQLSGDVQWTITPKSVGKNISGDTITENSIVASVTNLKIDNEDAKGEGQLTWRTSDPAKAISKRRFPGELDLQATLTRAQASRVWRYLPISIPKTARDYVRDAIIGGSSKQVNFTIKGDMSDMPSKNPKNGVFRIAAKVDSAQVAYIPRKTQAADELRWPELHKINGDLLIDKHSLAVKSAGMEVVGLARTRVSEALVSIPDFTTTVVNVNAKGAGPLVEILGFVNSSPTKKMINDTLAQSVINGAGEFKVDLALPIADLRQSRVNGVVTFLGNDVQITPTTPQLMQAKGLVNFSEKGFSIKNASAQMLGGEVRFEGGNVLTPNGQSSNVVIKGQGTASALALQHAKKLSVLPQIAAYASGSAPYSAELRFRSGQSELTVESTLLGMGLSLPVPMNKSAQAAMAVRYNNTLIETSLQMGRDGKVRPKDQIHLTVEKLADIRFTRDLAGDTPRVLQGGIGIGLLADEFAPDPDVGVAANINVAHADVDEWAQVLKAMSNQVPNTNEIRAKQSVRPDNEYAPNTIALRAKTLIVQGKKFENVVMGASRDASTWRANVDASQFNGYIEYRTPTDNNAGRIYARLARLALGETQVKEVEQLLDEKANRVPALDLIVEDFELKGRKLGRIEIEAVNLAAVSKKGFEGHGEWRLNRFNVNTPEAKFAATGVWSDVAQASTRMDFTLDITDSGKLLTRFGIKETVAGGAGKLHGQIAWRGSPLSMNYPTMTGKFNLNIEKGQFLKADPGVGKLLSILSMQTIMKRITFDFRDVFSSGFAFDFVRGDVTIDHGQASTNNFQMSGVNAVVLIDGKSDIARETQELRVVIAPEVNAGVASLLVATAINPAIGLGTFLAQLFLRQPLIEAATRELEVKGTWTDPVISEVKHTTKPVVKKQ